MSIPLHTHKPTNYHYLKHQKNECFKRYSFENDVFTDFFCFFILTIDI